MSTETSGDQHLAGQISNGVRVLLGFSGLVAIVFGLLVLFWPGHVVTVLVWLLAIYAIVGGLVYLGLGLFAKDTGGWARVGHILLGIVFVVAGVIAFMNTTQTAAWLAVFIAIFVAVMWIVEGVVALTTLRDTPSKGWTVFFAILSIVAGVVLILSPLWGALFLATLVWIYVSISLLVLGVVQIVRAFRFTAVAA